MAEAAVGERPLESVDLMDPGLYEEGPPHELYERLRAEAPVCPHRSAAGQRYWSLTRQAEVSEVSRDTDTFSSYRDGIFLHPDQVMPLDFTRHVLLYKDPPEHTKYRKILQWAFTPHTVAALEDDVRALVTRAIDEVIEHGECDFVRDIAVPVPLRVLALLLGVPDDDIPRLYRFTEEIEAAQNSPEPAGAQETFGEMGQYLAQQIQVQAQREDDSLVKRLRAAEVEGDRLDDAEILTFFALLVFAGNDTTRNTASGGLLALLQHPEQLEMLRGKPEMVPQAVEEILRWTSVVNYFARTATRDAEIGGCPIAEGEKVVMWYTSASRDGDVYDDPQRFDITRAEQSHKAFGGGGRHFCLGAGLARLELKVVFEEVTRRMVDLRQTGPVQRLRSPWANSLTSLPVQFTPGSREAG